MTLNARENTEVGTSRACSLLAPWLGSPRTVLRLQLYPPTNSETLVTTRAHATQPTADWSELRGQEAAMGCHLYS